MNLRGLLRTYRRWARSLTLSVLLTTFAAIAEAATLVLVGPMAQLVADGTNRFEGSLGPVSLDLARSDLVWAAIIATIVALALQLLSAWVRGRIVASYEKARRLELMDAYLWADFDLQRRDREGRMQTRFGGFVNQGTHAMNSLVGLIRGGVSMFVLFATSILISPLFAGLMAVFAVLLAALTRPIITAARRASTELADAQLVAAEEVAESTGAVREVRTFGVQDAVAGRVGAHSRRISRIRKRQTLIQGAVAPVYQSLGLLVVIGTLSFATAIEGIDLAAFGAVAILLMRSISYGQQLQAAHQKLSESLPYIERLDETMEEFRSSSPTFGEAHLTAVRAVELRTISYTYPGQGDGGLPQIALRGVSVSMSAGESVGVVGPSGSGKSTLAQLLLRLRAPDEGDFLVNGQRAVSFSETSWARTVALVPQEARLVHGTINENLRFHRSWIDDATLVDAAERAGLHETILELPDGYQTEMGPSTRALSGGQLQRLSIARALAGGPSLIIFDEPTSALDVESEIIIRDTIAGLGPDVIRLVIAHRLSTLDACDRLVVLVDGKVAADGPRLDVLETSDFLRGARERGYLDATAESPGHAGVPTDG